MTSNTEATTEDNQYKLESIEATEPPEGNPAGDWCRYVLGRGRSKIVGFHPGSIQVVTDYANHYAEELNNRSFLSGSPYSQRNKK